MILDEEIITVIITTYKDNQECTDWLKEVLKEEGVDRVDVKMLSHCRGVEYPELVNISEGDTIGEEGSVLLDAWTRVTSSLYIHHSQGEQGRYVQQRLTGSSQDKDSSNRRWR